MRNVGTVLRVTRKKISILKPLPERAKALSGETDFCRYYPSNLYHCEAVFRDAKCAFGFKTSPGWYYLQSEAETRNPRGFQLFQPFFHAMRSLNSLPPKRHRLVLPPVALLRSHRQKVPECRRLRKHGPGLPRLQYVCILQQLPTNSNRSKRNGRSSCPTG